MFLYLRVTDLALVIHAHLHQLRCLPQVDLFYVAQAQVPGVDGFAASVANFPLAFSEIFFVCLFQYFSAHQ